MQLETMAVEARSTISITALSVSSFLNLNPSFHHVDEYCTTFQTHATGSAKKELAQFGQGERSPGHVCEKWYKWLVIMLTLFSTDKNTKNSPFLRLPAEIRDHIYGYVVGGHHIDMWIAAEGRGGLVHTSKPESAIGDATSYNRNRWLYHRNLDRRVMISLSHLRVCRQVYQESGLLHYSLNIFSWVDKLAMTKFWRNSLAAQRRAIRHVMTDWPVTKFMMKDLTGLETAVVLLFPDEHCEQYYTNRYNVHHLQPLRSQSILTEFWKANGVKVRTKYVKCVCKRQNE